MNRFLPLILCVLFMYGGCQMFKINEGKTSETQKKTNQDLCEKGIKTTAILQDEYTEMEVGSSVSYMYKYDYNVNGKTYTGKITKREELTVPVLEVTYNSENPESVTTTNPCEVYAKIKDLPSRWPQWFEYVGAGLFLLSLGFVKSSAIRAFTGK